MELLDSLITRSLSLEDNITLCEAPFREEVKTAMRSIPQDSSPGPDGFSSTFYMSCWDIVGEDVREATVDFFSGSMLPNFYTSTYIVLIPKVKIETFTSFSSTFYMSCWDIVGEDVREATVDFFSGSMLPNFYTSTYIVLIPKVKVPGDFGDFRPISLCSEQGAFIEGRSIFHNIALVQELLWSFNRKIRGGNAMLKVDMMKAYDRVEWNFLMAILNAFGFSTQFWRSPFSILVHYCRRDFYMHVTTGCLDQCIGNYSLLVGAPPISHLLYADDLIIFCNGSKSSIKAMVEVLAHTLIKKECATPVEYLDTRVFSNYHLGAPISPGRLCIRHFESLIMKGEVDSKVKRHWVNFGNITQPFSEGGLDIRDLVEVQMALKTRFAWKICFSNSLLQSSKSKKIRYGISNGEKLISGKIIGLVGDRYQTWGWNEDVLADLIGSELAKIAIEHVPRLRKGLDTAVWKPSPDDLFSTGSTWELIQAKWECVDWDKWVWAIVKWWISELCVDVAKASILSLSNFITLQTLGIQIRKPLNKVTKFVRWMPHLPTWIKLNIDGCCIGNHGNCGGGGVIRANKGEFIYAFHTFYGHGTNTWMELKAVLDAIHICDELNFPKIIIESDS
ncbi:uncharacterized protein LOC111366695 [Olea europaea var. sylvestris]|uniref:uncharacterized protein LOC111366695 n=1 Tax=Olea europaea var. sylvestris TaxID=158386 RepID=UPI000C1CD26B|nr:uncharacterized protein LOC111366695 [Olea europaea var. sylvestris]